MDAFILAAGRGERMMPLTEHTPKPLLEVAGLSLIEIHLYRLARAGFKRVIINIAYLKDQILQRLGDGSRYGLNIIYSPEPNGALETAGGIQNALAMINSEQFVLINADILTDYPFKQLIADRNPDQHLHSSQRRNNHLVLVANPPQHPNGDFYLDQDRPNYAQASVSTEPERTAPRYTYSGIARLSKDLFHALPAGRYPLAPLLHLAIDNNQISAELYKGRWLDIGTAERLQQANQDVELQAWISELSASTS